MQTNVYVGKISEFGVVLYYLVSDLEDVFLETEEIVLPERKFSSFENVSLLKMYQYVTSLLSLHVEHSRLKTS